ncbi:MAG: PTS lactose transporter subunit IIC, partial [Bacilli bacterium]
GLSALIFRKRYSYAERAYGIASMLFGMAMISEAAIPFVFRDPLRVIAGTLVGGLVSTFIIVTFDVSMTQWSGGLFATGSVIKGATWWFVSIAAGSIVTALVTGFLKPQRYAD